MCTPHYRSLITDHRSLNTHVLIDKFMNFIYQSFPNKIYFGDGQLKKLPAIVNELGGTRLFVISTSRTMAIVDELINLFGNKNVSHFSKIVQHVPKMVVDEAIAVAKENRSNLIVAIGGGSAIGLAKGMALENHLPILAIPTTYAGSEMTNIYGISSGGMKTVGRDLGVLPKTVIYDPSLTAKMPIALAATSSMNAMAHLIEAIYAHDCNPITYQTSLMGIRFLKEGMELLISEKSLENANANLQFGAYLAGKALCEVTMSLHHKAAHVLGGSFGMEHGRVHTALLPYVLEYQMPGIAKTVSSDLQNIFNDQSPALKLRTLARQMGSATTLKAIGFKEQDIPEAARLVVAKPFPNPVEITEKGIEALLKRAYQGHLKEG